MRPDRTAWGVVVEQAVDGGYPDLEIIEVEIERWLVQHDIADAMFESLSPEHQAVIRETGQPSIVPLTALVGCKPEVRQLARTILRRILEDTRTIRTTSSPWVVEPGRPGLSYPLGSLRTDVRVEPSDEKTETRNGARVERDEVVRRLDQMDVRVEQLRSDVGELTSVLARLEGLIRDVRAAGSRQPEPR